MRLGAEKAPPASSVRASDAVCPQETVLALPCPIHCQSSEEGAGYVWFPKDMSRTRSPPIKKRHPRHAKVGNARAVADSLLIRCLFWLWKPPPMKCQTVFRQQCVRMQRVILCCLSCRCLYAALIGRQDKLHYCAPPASAALLSIMLIIASHCVCRCQHMRAHAAPCVSWCRHALWWGSAGA